MANAPNVVDFWLWPLQWGLGFRAREAGTPDRREIAWATANETRADLPTLRLRKFSGAAAGAAPVLIVAPFAVHDSGIADLAPGHSIVAALAASGLGPIFVTEWKSATQDTATLSIDSYICDLNAAVDLVAESGGRPDLVGLCQGGWMSLLYAAAFPAKLRRLVVVGAPVDTSHPSSLTQGAHLLAPALLDKAVAAGGGVVDGAATLAAFHASGSAETEASDVLQVDGRALQEDGAKAALDAYAAWDQRTLDLPGRYYLDVLNWLFRDNRLAEGSFPVFGRAVPLSRVVAPLYLLAGTNDRIAPPAQVRAAMDLVATAAENVVYAEADCGHLSLFLGAKTLGAEWAKIGAWLGKSN